MATIQCVTDVFDLLSRTKPASWAMLRGGSVEEIIQAWYLALEPLPDEAMMAAALGLSRKKGDHMPGAGTLFDATLDLLDPELGVIQAWVAVEAKVRGKGTVPPDRALSVLKAMSGGKNWTEEDLPFRRREFEKLYEAEGKRWRSGVASGRLALPTVGEGKGLTDGHV